jgi:hypothetical protein
MKIIHLTRAAADPLDAFGATAARFLPLADGSGNMHVSCLHLEEGGTVTAPSIDHAAALLCVHGRITITTLDPAMRIDIHAGMGCILKSNEPYSIESGTGAIVIIVESDSLSAHERGISTPERIAGARWPSDAVLTLRLQRQMNRE